jgi:hypothetical protein
MRLIPLFFLSFLFFSMSFSQSDDQSKTEWFPPGLNVQPFTANFLEPKAGFSYLLGRREIRLDIGTSSDIYHYTKDNTHLSFGADLFTYTRLRGESEFHFPVEAVDYLFGINGSYKIKNEGNEYGIRIRLSHISAHFADGHFDNRLGIWQDGRSPRTYSREFIEIFPYYRIKGIRAYLGFTYLLHVTPKRLGKDIYQAGFDYFAASLISDFISPFAAYDFKLAHTVENYSGSNILTAGIKFGRYDSKGFSILISYYSGKSIHGEYFDINENYASFGFNVDL